MLSTDQSITETLLKRLSVIKNAKPHHRVELQDFSHKDFFQIYEAKYQDSPLFDSNMANSNYSNWSFFGIKCGFKCKYVDNKWLYKLDNQNWNVGPNFLSLISNYHSQIFDENYTSKEPFPFGFTGYFSYDYPFEDLSLKPQKPHSFDLASFFFYETTINYHHESKTLIINSIDPNELNEVAALFQSKHAKINKDYSVGPLAQKTSFASYQQKLQNIFAHIESGDIYQANFTHKFEAEFKGDRFSLYKKLRTANPAPFGSFYPVDEDKAILSTSPERFFQIIKNRILSFPIKGTIKRDTDPIVDESNKKILLNSNKDQAELAMIVDLIRNDLGRICQFNSIKVNEWKKLESFQKVHHLVGNIEGTLVNKFDFESIFKSMSPGGSITGAPKIKSMQVLSELEEDQRGPYTGTLGYICLNGNMDFNILIRTLLQDRNQITLQVGGGIVIDSKIDAEYQETLDKAEAIVDILKAKL